MAFIDLFKKTYRANVYCNNCNTHSEVSIPKGITVLQFVETGICPNCGCSVLITDYKQKDEFKLANQKSNTKFKLWPVLNQKPVLKLTPRPVPAPQQETQRPIPENFKSKKIYKDDLDFWAGRSS